MVKGRAGDPEVAISKMPPTDGSLSSRLNDPTCGSIFPETQEVAAEQAHLFKVMDGVRGGPEPPAPDACPRDVGTLPSMRGLSHAQATHLRLLQAREWQPGSS